MRVASSTLSGSSNNEITVIRGALGTVKESHSTGSLIRKINPLPVEFHRPSYVRASGHTFEYLGYGPGNYSTGLPQVQVKSLDEKEEYLSQSQERDCGIVVYTGMNNDGDFFIGNKKINSATGKETNFDIPVSTITGEDPSRLSVIFDEIIVKERILVEGGNSGTVLSQFDGPVKFNNDIRINGETVTNDIVTIKSGNESTSTTTGDLVVFGGVGIGGNLNVGGDFEVDGQLTLSGETTISTGLIPDSNLGAYVGTATTRFSEAYFGNIRIAVTNDQTIDTLSGKLILDSSTNEVEINADLDLNGDANISGDVVVGGGLSVTGDITAFYTSDQRLKDNVTPIEDPLTKVLSISGNTYDWNENSGKEGHDVGVIAQEVLEVLPEAVTTRDNGYLAVDYQKIVPLLVEAVKELSAKVKDLENK